MPLMLKSHYHSVVFILVICTLSHFTAEFQKEFCNAFLNLGRTDVISSEMILRVAVRSFIKLINR